MKSVLSSSYIIKNDKIVIVGLRWLEETKKFEQQIGILMNGEKVIFNESEWGFFKNLGPVLFQYFETGTVVSSNNMVNHQVLFSTREKRQVVIKCLTSWNTIRLKRKDLECLTNLIPCIDVRMMKLETLTEYSTHVMKTIIQTISAKIINENLETFHLFEKLLQFDKNLAGPPKTSTADINTEINNLNGDRITVEISRVYKDFLLKAIKEEVFSQTPYSLKHVTNAPLF